MRVIRLISELEFFATDPFRRVIVHKDARRFAAIPFGAEGREIAVSWQSDSIDPLVKMGAGATLWIAIDQRVAAVQCPEGGVAVAFQLPSNALDLQLFSDVSLVVCETHLFAINTDGSLRSLVQLRDIPGSVQRSGEQLLVAYGNGETDRILRW